MSALTTLEMDLDCTHKESIKKFTRQSLVRWWYIKSEYIIRQRYKRQVFILNSKEHKYIFIEEKRSEKSAFFPSKNISKSKINKISDLSNEKGTKPVAENHRDRLSLCLSRAREWSSSNERWSTRKGKNRAKKHPRSSKLWCALAFSPREKKKKKKRRNDSSSLRLFFFDCFRGNKKSLIFFFRNQPSPRAMRNEIHSYLNLGGLEAGDGRDLLSSSKHDVYVDVFYLKS